MNAPAAAAINAMGQCISREMAQHWARRAAKRGATPAELAEAWAEWDRLQDAQVQVFGGRP